MCCTCLHLEDITIKCIFVSAILNLSHQGQQLLPIPRTSKMTSSVKKTMFRTEWTKCLSKCVSMNGLVALSNIHDFKPRSNTARKYWSPTKLFVIRKIFWMYLYRNCLRRYTKCVAFLELDGIKKKLSSLCQILAGNFLLLYGPFPEFARVFALYAAGVNVQAVRNIDFSYFINLIRNSSTLRPLELEIFFCKWTWTHVWSIDACLVSCFRGSQ